MRNIHIMLAIVFSSGVYAYEPVPSHLHSLTASGVLSEPNESFSLEIHLDPETDNVEVFDIWIDNQPVFIDPNFLQVLTDIELSTLKIFVEPPYEDISSENSLYFETEFGEEHRKSWQDGDNIRYTWERDKISFSISRYGVGLIVSPKQVTAPTEQVTSPSEPGAALSSSPSQGVGN